MAELGVVALDRTHRSLPIRRGIARRIPVAEQLVVHPHQGQRHTRHVQGGDELAGLDVGAFEPGGLQPGHDAGRHHEQFLVLACSEPVDDGHHPVPGSRGTIRQQALDEGAGHVVGAAQVGLGDTRFAVNAEPDSHAPRGHGEQRSLRAGQRAAGEGNPETAGGRVGPGEHPSDLVEPEPGLGRRARDLEDREIPCDSPPLLRLGGIPRGDVVGDHQGVGLDTLGAKPLNGLPEVQHVAGVVAEPHQHPGPAMNRLQHRIGLGGRGGTENVAAHRAVGEPVANPAREGRVVPGTAAIHDRDLPGRREGGTRHAPVDGFHVAFVGRDETFEGLGGKISGIVCQSRHCVPFDCWPEVSARPVRRCSRVGPTNTGSRRTRAQFNPA